MIFILVLLLYNSFKMSLFVGNISKRVTVPQFEQAFRNFGRCRVDLRVCHPTSEKKFAFVQYDNEKEAESAKNELHNSDLCGLKLNIEWAKNSGRFQENNNRGGRKDYGGGRRYFHDNFQKKCFKGEELGSA